MAQKQHKLTIHGMHCTSCSLLIDGDLEDTEGIISATTHYARQETHVVFDDEKISIERVIEVIRRAGYEVATVS